MAYIVKAFTPGKLNLAPETLEEEVLQNVAIIVSTPKFSVPLDRGHDDLTSSPPSSGLSPAVSPESPT